jgi:predicted Zn-dependent protease with MMP-like domain
MAPHRSSPQELIAHRVLAQVMKSLPPEIYAQIEHCKVELCEMRLCKDEYHDPALLGLFEGNGRHDPEPQSPEELPRIRLFLDNLWDYAEHDPALYRHEVRTTLLHELAHYLGLDESQVEALGLA